MVEPRWLKMTYLSPGLAMPSEPHRYRGRPLRIQLVQGAAEIRIAGHRPPAIEIQIAYAPLVTVFPTRNPAQVVRLQLVDNILTVNWGDATTSLQWDVPLLVPSRLEISPIEMVAPRKEEACPHGVYPIRNCLRCSAQPPG
jgi:hypothetical protein